MVIDPGTATVIAAGIKGASSIFGGILGGKDGPSLGKQMEYGWADAYHKPSYAVAGAKKAGLHPLFALGKTPAFNPSIIAGQSRSGSMARDALGAAAEGLEDYAHYRAGDAERAQQRALGDK